MPYQGSTQSIGFKQRVAPDSSKRMRRVAQDLEKQTVDQVTSMQRQASGQMQEMRRIDSVLTQKDEYDLQKLRQFSSSLNDAMKTTAETVGKAYIDQKREEGIELEERARAGDQEAIEKLKLSDEQVADIDKRVNAQAEKTGKKLDELGKYRLSLEQQQRVLNARKLGSNIAWGYRKGALMQARKGFLAWHSDQTTTNDQKIKLSNGKTVAIRDYDGLDLGEKEEINRHLKFEYIKQNGSDLNQNVVRKYLTKGITEDVDKLNKQELTYEVRQQALEERDKLVKDVELAFENAEDNPQGVHDAFQALFSRSRSIHKRLGYAQPGIESRKFILSDVIIKQLSQMEEGSIKGEEDMEDGISVLETGKFDLPGLGKKTLKEHFGEDFDPAELRAKAIELRASNFSKEQGALTQLWGERVNDIKSRARAGEFGEGNKRDQRVQLEFQKLHEEFDQKGLNGVGQKMQDLVKWKPFYLSKKATEAEFKRLDRKFNGKIPASLTLTWDRETKERYKEEGKIVDTPWLSTTSEVNSLSRETLKIHGLLEEKRNITQTTDKNPQDLIDIKLKADRALAARVDQILADGYVIKSIVVNGKVQEVKVQIRDNNHAIEEAGESLANEILFHNSTNGPKDGTWTADPTNGYASVQERSVYGGQSGETAEVRNAKRKANRDNIERELDDTPGDLFTEKLVIDNKDDLELKHDGQPNELFQLLAKIDPRRRSAHELFNLQREAAGLKAIKWDKDQQKLIDDYHALNPQIKADLASGNPNRRERAIDKIGAIDLRTVHNAAIGANLNIKPELLNKKLERAGMTLEEYNTEEGKVKFFRSELNYLTQLAIKKTDNKDIALRMIAAGLVNGEDEMENWEGGDTNAMLQNYYSGSNHLPSDIDYSDVNYSAATPDDYTLPEESSVISEDETGISFRGKLRSRQIDLKNQMLLSNKNADRKNILGYSPFNYEYIKLRNEAIERAKAAGHKRGSRMYQLILLDVLNERLGRTDG